MAGRGQAWRELLARSAGTSGNRTVDVAGGRGEPGPSPADAGGGSRDAPLCSLGVGSFGRRPAQAGIRGLRAGLLRSSAEFRFSLRRFSDVRGVELTGTLDIVAGRRGPLLQLQGTVKVKVSRGVSGTLTVSGSRLTGWLGGTRVPR